ncbi:hypothetical protein ACFW5D_37575, partial [Streptomyces sp. NPDC058770]|uniref:hypothetical protein n=1 Tax=Streptomyces sp. NPDC058770 TaxID=3346631 RepID=UPI00368A8E5A
MGNLVSYVAAHAEAIVVLSWVSIVLAIGGLIRAALAELRTPSVHAVDDSRATYTLLVGIALLWQAGGPGRAIFLALYILPIITVLVLVVAKLAIPAAVRALNHKYLAWLRPGIDRWASDRKLGSLLLARG